MGDQLWRAELSTNGRATGSRLHPGRQSQQLARFSRHRAGASGFDQGARLACLLAVGSDQAGAIDVNGTPGDTEVDGPETPFTT